MRNLNRQLTREPVARESLPSYREARARWGAFRDAEGVPGGPVALLTAPDGNAKYAKTQVPVYGLSLAPDKSSGYAVCDYSTCECRKGCVAFAGKGPMFVVIRGRRLKTRFLAADPAAFLAILTHEISSAKARHGGTVGVRLNGFSDLCWELIAPWLFEEHADVAFYDYTKRPFGSRDVPSNYHLTYSVSEHTCDDDIARVIAGGASVAVVLNVRKSQSMPDTWQGAPVVDGDKSDFRPADAPGSVVGLRAKGIMRKGTWGMVREAS